MPGTPQTNGVVTTLKATAETLTGSGHDVRVISPQGLASIAGPSYPEIRLALSPGAHVARELEGVSSACDPHRHRRAARAGGAPLLPRARRALHQLLSHALPGVPARALADPARRSRYAWLRRFHGAAARTFVSSASLQRQLSAARFRAPAPVAPRRRSAALPAAAAAPAAGAPAAAHHGVRGAPRDREESARRSCASSCRAPSS